LEYGGKRYWRWAIHSYCDQKLIADKAIRHNRPAMTVEPIQQIMYLIDLYLIPRGLKT
jgi:hypothetical protein